VQSPKKGGYKRETNQRGKSIGGGEGRIKKSQGMTEKRQKSRTEAREREKRPPKKMKTSETFEKKGGEE